MRVMSNGRVRRSESEWRELFSRFDRQPQPPGEFCRRERLKLTSFHRWRRRLEGRPVPAEFVTVTRESQPPPSVLPWSLEIVLPSGHKLRIEG
jgi:hypothetical protein